jgi:hypothetical protein
MEQTMIDFEYATLGNCRDLVESLEDSYFKPVTMNHMYVYFHSSKNTWRVHWRNNKKYKFKHVKEFKGEDSKSDAVAFAFGMNKIADFAIEGAHK